MTNVCPCLGVGGAGQKLAGGGVENLGGSQFFERFERDGHEKKKTTKEGASQEIKPL